MRPFPAFVYFGVIALLIIFYYFNGRLAKRFNASIVEAGKHLDRTTALNAEGCASLDSQAKIFEAATHDLLAAAWVKVATLHASYEFDPEALPGLITVKCHSCNEMVGTMRNEGQDEDTIKLPGDLIQKHINEVYRRQVSEGRAAAKALMAEIK